MLLAATLLLAAAAPDVHAIVREALDREIHHQRKLDDYTWQEEQVINLPKKDRVRSKVWDYFQIDGSSYRKLVSKDGKPLPPREAAREQRKMDDEMARRRGESPSQREKRHKAEAKEKAENIRFREEVLRAFDFRLEGEDSIAGEPAWRIAGTPKPGFKPSSRDGRFLAKVRGHLWVGKQTREWLKFDIETLDKLTFGAFLASVAPGARISSEQMRVNDELWHPRWLRVTAQGRAVLVRFNAEIEVAYRNFRRFSTESRILETGGAVDK